jgi:large subunit ribosomal protein L29
MAKDREIRERSIPELMVMNQDLEKEIFALRSELSVQRKLDKPHLLKIKRKERARVLTLLTQKQREGVTP